MDRYLTVAEVKAKLDELPDYWHVKAREVLVEQSWRPDGIGGKSSTPMVVISE